MPAKKRAITEKDKLKKREKLLMAAWVLYAKADGQLPTVTRIAQQAKLSKGCVYLYFRTKEEIFLQLYLNQLSNNFDWIAEDLNGSCGRISDEKLARIITRFVVENPLQLKMASQVRGVFEENTDDARLLDIKIQIGQMVEAMAETLSGRIEGLSNEGAVKLMVNVHALITGLWQFTHTTPHLKDKLAADGITMFEIDFSRDVHEAVTALIRGFLPQRP